LELIGYTISMFYSYRLNLPFSTYGENMFMTIQTTKNVQFNDVVPNC
jgi:mannose-P-dolichol utilization defect protein 1